MTLLDTLARDGRFPPVQMQIFPIDSDRPVFTYPRYTSNGVVAAGFLSYDFDSNIMIPVDSFFFEFSSPSDTPIYELIKEGDKIKIICNDNVICTGIVDTIEIRLDASGGEKCTVRGRDMMSQLEDQSAINDKDAPIWLNAISIDKALQSLIRNTRIEGLKKTPYLPGGNYQFPTEPGESKLSALIRFLEPFNLLLWMDPDGKLVIGKPDFRKPPDSIKPNRTFISSKTRKYSNMLSWRVSRNGATIPNRYLPIWAAQEKVANVVAPQQVMNNAAKRPTELRKTNHRITKSVVVSIPSGFDSGFVNNLKQAGVNPNSDAGSSNILQYFAKKEIARANIEELKVDIEVPGHYDIVGNPYRQNTMWYLDIERASLKQWMYCYAVKYRLDPTLGQVTTMNFCNINTIVADAPTS